MGEPPTTRQETARRGTPHDIGDDTMITTQRAILLTAILALAPIASFAQTGTLFVEGENVGIGTATPTSSLHVRKSNGNAKILVHELSSTPASRTMLQLANNGGIRFNFLSTNTNSNWELISGTTFVVNRGGSGVNEMIINSGGNVTIGGTLTQNSDRATKTDILAVNPTVVLAKVAELPIATWRKTGDTGTHLGPMAQDFAAAFGLGEDDRHIAVIDMAGVSLAAIQGLYDLVRDQSEEIQELRARLVDLEERDATADR
jgi:hypothetical protein